MSCFLVENFGGCYQVFMVYKVIFWTRHVAFLSLCSVIKCSLHWFEMTAICFYYFNWKDFNEENGRLPCIVPLVSTTTSLFCMLSKTPRYYCSNRCNLLGAFLNFLNSFPFCSSTKPSHRRIYPSQQRSFSKG